MPPEVERPGEPDLTDPDNPEWTEEDFAAARPASELPDDILAQFPKTPRARGPQRAPTKEHVTFRLSRDVVAKLRSSGPGWQARADDMLRKALGL